MSTIVNNTYFVGEIFLPQAKATITSDVSDIDSDLIDFICDREEECLSYCLGELYLEFKSKLDLQQDNGIEVGVDEKWDWLLNGKEYINPKGKKRFFKGLRFKSPNTDEAEYNRSLIAYYIYYWFKRDQYVSTTGIGDSIPKAKNAEVVSPSIKITNAWRHFYRLTAGEPNSPKVFFNERGYGIDYFRPDNLYVSLYKFIEDINTLTPNTYEGFEPREWDNLNQAGL